MLSKKSPFLFGNIPRITDGSRSLIYVSHCVIWGALGFSRDRRDWECARWTEGSERQGLEVLYNGGEMKFITRAGKPSQPHAFKAVVNLEVSKTHLNALALIP